MPEPFPAAGPILPHFILYDFNLLRGFIWYVSIMFGISLLLRLRFYGSVFSIARHVTESCPNVTSLILQHRFLCIANGLVVRIGIYSGILGVYMALNRWVWPSAFVSLADLAQPYPIVLVGHLVLIGIMITLDTLLIAQVSVVDVDRVTHDLSEAEGWLGGSINQILGLLGKWNPIKKYADATTRETIVWFNEITRNNLTLLIVQPALRILVAFSLFSSYYLLDT